MRQAVSGGGDIELVIVARVFDLAFFKIGSVGEGSDQLETSLRPRGADDKGSGCTLYVDRHEQKEWRIGLCMGWGHGGGRHVGAWLRLNGDRIVYCRRASLWKKLGAALFFFFQIICIWGWRMCELLGSMRSVQMEPHSCLNRFLLRSRLDKGNLPEDSL